MRRSLVDVAEVMVRVTVFVASVRLALYNWPRMCLSIAASETTVQRGRTRPFFPPALYTSRPLPLQASHRAGSGVERDASLRNGALHGNGTDPSHERIAPLRERESRRSPASSAFPCVIQTKI